MKRYSGYAVFKSALTGNRHWRPAWRNPQVKTNYEVVIIGAGGHGLATAYYLAKHHGITDIAVLEKGWLGGGGTGRNTTVVRSNYLYPESANFYNFSLEQYEGLSSELNFNIMFNQHGNLILFHDRHSLIAAGRLVNAMMLNGIEVVELSPGEIHELIPILDMQRFPILGGYTQPRAGTIRHDAVAWAYARAADSLGVDIIQQCEVTDFTVSNHAVNVVHTNQGDINVGKVGFCASAHSGSLARKAGFELPIQSMALQAMVTEPLKPCLHTNVLSPKTGVYLSQSDHGEIVIGGALDLCPSFAQRGSAEVLERVVAGAIEMVPRLASVKLMRQWAGTVDISFDSSPIIGKTPIQNVYVNCGFGTGGFKAIPAGGFTLAHTIANDEPHELNAAFCLERFSHGRFIDEMRASGIAH